MRRGLGAAGVAQGAKVEKMDDENGLNGQLFADSLLHPLRCVTGQCSLDPVEAPHRRRVVHVAEHVVENANGRRGAPPDVPRGVRSLPRTNTSAKRSLSMFTRAVSTGRGRSASMFTREGDDAEEECVRYVTGEDQHSETNQPPAVLDVHAIIAKARSYKATHSMLRAAEGDSNKAEPGAATSAHVNIIMYVVGEAGIFLIEVVSLVVLHLLWGRGDFLCTQGGGAHVSNIAVLLFLLAVHLLHAARDFLIVATSIGWLPAWMGVWFSGFSSQRSVSGRAGEAAVWSALVALSALVIAESVGECTSTQAGEDTEGSSLASLASRWHAALHLARVLMSARKCFRLGEEARAFMQVAVSGNKRRFVDALSSLDLDLTYVTDRLLAMALPAVAGAAYRNDIRDVARFLTSRHYGAFKVFNLSEAFEDDGNGNYDPLFFHGQVVRIPMRDHNICPLVVLVSFCQQATAWLNLDDANVVVVHCRGGKGRTGAFVSALMVWAGFCSSAVKAMGTFVARRTDLGRAALLHKALQGVSSPTQVRYVHYVEAVRTLATDFVSSAPICLSRVQVRGLPRRDLGGCLLTVIAETQSGIVYDHAKEHGLTPCFASGGSGEEEVFTFSLADVPVSRDVALRFYVFDKAGGLDAVKHSNCTLSKGGQVITYQNPQGVRTVGKVLFFAQWHTSFHRFPSLHLARHEIDMVYSKPFSQFSEAFSLEISINDSLSALRPVPYQELQPVSYHGLPALRPVSYQGLEGGGGGASLVSEARQEDSAPLGWGQSSHYKSTLELSTLDYQSTLELFRAAGATEHVFVKGQRVREAHEQERSMCLIVHGHVAVFPHTRRSWADAPYFNPGLLRLFLHRGEGELVGELEFLLGAGADLTTPLVVATSKHVVVLKLMVAETSDGTCSRSSQPAALSLPPLLEGVLSPSQSAGVYERVARALSRQAILHDHTLATARQERVKTLGNSRQEALLDRKLLALRKTFRIALSQECILQTSCKLLEGGNQSRGTLLLLGSACQIFVFADAVFLSLSNARASQIGVRAIASAEAVGAQVTLFLKPSAVEDHDTQEVMWQSQHVSVEADLRCFATTRFECVDCATALALRDAIRKVATTLQSRRRSSVFEGNHYESTSSLLPKVSEGEGERSPPGGVEELGELLEDCLDVEFEKGQTILEEGSWNRTLYMVTSGFALARASNGKVLVRRGPGEMFGEVSFYGSGNRGAGCSVLAGARATTVKTLDAAYLARCRAADPMREARIHRWVAGNIAQRVQTQVGQIDSWIDNQP